MEEIKVKGKVKQLGNYDWSFETDNIEYSSEILSGIDEILTVNKTKVLDNNDEIELIIKIKRTK